MLDVLLLLSVSGGFLKGFDDERRRGWDDGNGGLTVLDGKLYCDSQTFLKRANGQTLQASNFHRKLCIPSHQ